MSEKGWKSLKQKLKTITRKTTPCSFDKRISRINEVQRGWLQYYRMASILGKLKDLDGWLRNRLRNCIWHHWKKPERKRKILIRLGIDHHHAYAWSRTRSGGWAVAQSPIMGTTITLERLHKRGYVAMLDIYLKIAPHLNEQLYTRTVRTMVLRQAQQNCERLSPSADGEHSRTNWRGGLLDWAFGVLYSSRFSMSFLS